MMSVSLQLSHILIPHTRPCWTGPTAGLVKEHLCGVGCHLKRARACIMSLKQLSLTISLQSELSLLGIVVGVTSNTTPAPDMLLTSVSEMTPQEKVGRVSEQKPGCFLQVHSQRWHFNQATSGRRRSGGSSNTNAPAPNSSASFTGALAPPLE